MRALWIHFASVLFLFGAIAHVSAGPPTDEDFQGANGGGLQKALGGKSPTLKPDKNIEGKTFEADDAFGQKACKAKFKFEIAKTGTYDVQPKEKEKQKVKGVYVKISATYDKNKCEATCKNVKILQVVRHSAKNGTGDKETTEPASDEEKERAGWAQPNAPSHGWGVDTADHGPFFGPGGVDGSEQDGSTDTPAIERDAPGRPADKAENEGYDFVTCAVCVNPKAKSKIIACVNWGFYIDGNAPYRVTFDPTPPVGTGSPPKQVKDALDRFEQLKGSTSANIQF